jgi:hypothetical protein
MVVVQSAELLRPGAAKKSCNPHEQDCDTPVTLPVIARGFREDCSKDTNSSGICVHVRSTALVRLHVLLSSQHQRLSTRLS